MPLLAGDKAPWFGGKCYQSGRYLDLCLDDLAGSWILFFFYPLDFEHIAPSELLELERRRPRLESIGCRIVAVSRDGVLAHAAFAAMAPVNAGVSGIRFPLLEDPTGRIAEAYGMLMPDGGVTFRGCCIIDPEGIVRGRTISDLPVALDIKVKG
jgi:peroxiredoxin (alkyl hydroperoxide reductase subunit C)